MSFRLIGLGKVLRAMYAGKSQRRAMLRADIRREQAKAKPSLGPKKKGGDFYVSFWADARGHVAGDVDLRLVTEERVKANTVSRKRLYPKLKDGFLLWWEENRRLRNVKFATITDNLKSRYDTEAGIIKVESLLAFTVGDDGHRIVYPYLFEEPELSEEAARLALWVMHQCVAKYELEDFRVLDVIRGRSYSVIETPLRGDEERLFRENYLLLLEEWDTLSNEMA